MLRKVVFLMALAIIVAIAVSPPLANACTRTAMQTIEKAQAVQNQRLNPATVAQSATATANTKKQDLASTTAGRLNGTLTKVVFAKKQNEAAAPAWWSVASVVRTSSLAAVRAAPMVAVLLVNEQGTRIIIVLAQNFPNPFNETDPAAVLAVAMTDSASTLANTDLAVARTMMDISATTKEERANRPDLAAAGRYNTLGPTSNRANALAIPAPSNTNVILKAT